MSLLQTGSNDMYHLWKHFVLSCLKLHSGEPMDTMLHHTSNRIRTIFQCDTMTMGANYRSKDDHGAIYMEKGEMLLRSFGLEIILCLLWVSTCGNLR